MRLVKNMNNNKLAKAATKAGMILLESGAETNRVEDTMHRICKNFGAITIDSFATPTLIIISFSVNDEHLVHNIKRTHIKNIDLTKIDRVNTLSRIACTSNMTLDEFNQQLNEIDQEERYSWMTTILAVAICSFGFAIFFHASFKDALCALACGVLLKLFLRQLDTVNFDTFFKNLAGGAFVTFLAILCRNLQLCDSMDKVIISVIMLLVPGLAITNAIRDTVSGDLLSGLSRTAEAIFIASAIALGSGLVFVFLGGM